MISNEVKERLLQKDWYVHCQTKQKSDLLLQACDEAGLRWSEGEKATGYCPQESYPFDIGIRQGSHGLYFDKYDMFEKSSAENITDWFFDVIENTNVKLTPQNAEQEHLVQILLAMMQGLYVEEYNDDNCFWKPSDSNCIFLNTEYRIAPKPNSLITREMWAMIAPEWKWAAMDGDGEVYFYTDEPCISTRDWMWTCGGGDYCNSVLAINTDSINWERSLTERPEDV